MANNEEVGAEGYLLNEELCEPSTPTCSTEQQQEQQASLANILQQAQEQDLEDIILPNTLLRIKLCDGTETYLLENEALQLGGNYSVLQEIPIANSSQTFMLSTSINGMDLGDLFSLNLHYNEGNGSLGAQAQKNGNIAWIKWQVAGRDQQAYGFQYDELDRLTQAKYADISNTGAYATENQYGVYGISYDKNGNINSLNRYGLNPNSGSNCQINIDQLSYTYFPNSNRLQKVADAAPTATRAQGFNPNGKSGDFAYDRQRQPHPRPL